MNRKVRWERKDGQKTQKEWFDNDAYWEAFYPFMFSEKRFAGTEEEIDKILALANQYVYVARLF